MVCVNLWLSGFVYGVLGRSLLVYVSLYWSFWIASVCVRLRWSTSVGVLLPSLQWWRCLREANVFQFDKTCPGPNFQSLLEATSAAEEQEGEEEKRRSRRKISEEAHAGNEKKKKKNYHGKKVGHLFFFTTTSPPPIPRTLHQHHDLHCCWAALHLLLRHINPELPLVES